MTHENASRRDFLSRTLMGAGAIALGDHLAAAQNESPLVVGVMGLSRGRELAREFSTKPNVRVKYLCDTDSARLTSAVTGWTDKTNPPPEGVQDWRRILDDPQVQILVCAAPNHWHGPATILACAAGKHVYVEKPCAHNPQEGEWIMAAAARYNKCVQVGTQRRSSEATQAAIRKLHEGVLGRVYLARGYYYNQRGPIGHAEPSAPPPELNYDLWQGPAAPRPYRENVIHYNWHWFWNWGGGELANNGVHVLDLCRWGLQVDYPISVASGGGRYAYEDDQETPDTQMVAWDFADRKQITWQGLSCNKHGGQFVEFFGEEGALELGSDGTHRVYNRANKLVEEVKGNGVGQAEHVANFLAAVRAGDPTQLNCGITTAHPSTLLCNVGNIAQRVGRRLTTSAENGHILGDDEAAKLWEREYAEGWRDKLAAAAGAA